VKSLISKPAQLDLSNLLEGQDVNVYTRDSKGAWKHVSLKEILQYEDTYFCSLGNEDIRVLVPSMEGKLFSIEGCLCTVKYIDNVVGGIDYSYFRVVKA